MNIESKITAEPTPGAFYSIRYGDTLFGVTSKAFGVAAGPERMELAGMINSAAYNDRFRGAATNLFRNGLISFNPKFAGDLQIQAAADLVAPGGHAYATIWIPRYPADEPQDDDDPGFVVVEIGADEDEDREHYLHSADIQETKYHFPYRVRTGDTLQSIATAMDVRWEYLARLNWGTVDPDEINWHLENYFVCTEKHGHNFVFTSQDSPGVLMLPKRLTARRRQRIRALRVSRFAVG